MRCIAPGNRLGPAQWSCKGVRDAMEILVWIGAAVSLLGLAGLLWCILRVARARRAGLEDDALRAEVQKVVPLNMGALMLSVLGLMMVILGISLG